MVDFFDFIAFCICIVVAAFAVIGAVFGASSAHSYLVYKPACAEYGRVSGQPTMYSLGTGCLVQRNGEWVDYDVAVGHKQEITVKSK